jgi:DNA-binding NarL/FixJ family response regulator
MARVLLVEDEPHTRTRLARAIEESADIELVGAAATVAEGARLLEAESPDVLLTDLGLPDGSGIDLLKRARASSPEIQSLVITVFGDEKSVVAAIEAGAGGYLLKDGTPRQIANSVRELLAGGAPISPPIARYLLDRMRPVGAPASEQAADHGLTERELEVLRLVARGNSHREIAELLNISANTVGTHVRHLYRKLEVGSRSQAVYEAVSLGLIRMDE